jgi:fructan beta-fructosidase
MTTPLFAERYRPQFHYSMERGWFNDPIGLVHYAGEYHLFNDHNVASCNFPAGTVDGEKSHWSHAISTDLVHWQHMPVAVYPDRLGACWSGSGVVDWNNTSGFQTGDEPPLVLIYTSAGQTFTQSLTVSNDRGQTWTPYANNPVLGQIKNANRDPKVFWHEPTSQWVMVLYVTLGEADFFTSPDLKAWTHTSTVELTDFHECPDLFELPIDGDPDNTTWLLHDARWQYWLGEFDGRTFTPRTERQRGEFGLNFHAAQSWNDAAQRIQIGWMANGQYPEMPFSQQMSFPCELTLRTIGNDVRLCRNPLPQIETLYNEVTELAGVAVSPGDDPLGGLGGELLDIDLTVAPNDGAGFAIRLHDIAITYAAGQVTCLGCTVDAPLIGGELHLRILLDRTSLEVFVNHGSRVMSSCILPEQLATAVGFAAHGRGVELRAARVTTLRSIWPA